jgi:hypothetical protein
MKLLALRCPECSQPLKPENDHIVVTCELCRAAVHIGDDGLSLVSVQYARPRSEAGVTRWLPFWVFHGRVQVKRRLTASGGRSRQEEMARLWGEPRYLYVPAWELSPRTVRDTGSKMIQSQPAYQAIARPADAHLTPVILTTQDALKMLEFIVLTIEAGRRDWLEHLEFRLEVGEPVLWALPADDQGVVACGKRE